MRNAATSDCSRTRRERRSRPRSTARREVLHLQAEGALLEADRVDLSLPGRRPPAGSLHPLTIVEREIVGVFTSLGFRVVEGPEIEDDWHNFQALNIPPDHPARTMKDSLYVAVPGHPELLLRTETSRGPDPHDASRSRRPSTSWRPGRVYRRETPDATHSPVFHQVEGLAVDEGITFADLKGTLEAVGQGPVRRTPAGSARAGVLPVRGAGVRGRGLVLQVRRCRVPRLRQRAGSSCSAQGWSTPRCSRTAATTASATRGSPSAWGSTALPC